MQLAGCSNNVFDVIATSVGEVLGTGLLSELIIVFVPLVCDIVVVVLELKLVSRSVTAAKNDWLFIVVDVDRSLLLLLLLVVVTISGVLALVIAEPSCEVGLGQVLSIVTLGTVFIVEVAKGSVSRLLILPQLFPIAKDAVDDDNDDDEEKGHVGTTVDGGCWAGSIRVDSSGKGSNFGASSDCVFSLFTVKPLAQNVVEEQGRSVTEVV